MLPTLHQHQKDGVNWVLSHLCSGLLFPPGLGKTLTVLTAIKTLKYANEIDRVLIVAPMRVCYLVWPLEIKKWGFNFSIGILHGPDKDTVVRKKHDIYVINPEGLKWLYNNHIQLFVKFRFMLVCDESTLFKNHTSQRFGVLKKMLKLFRRRVILTGTPVPNGLIQLWPQMFILDQGKRLFKYITHYRTRYFTPTYDGWGYDLKQGAEQDIYNAVDDVLMHKSVDELDLPPLLYNNILIDLPHSAAVIYKNMRNDFVHEFEADGEVLTALNAASKNMKLKQIANGSVYGDDMSYDIHDEKLKACEELKDSLSGRPLVVVYEFNNDLDRLNQLFGSPPAIRGGVKPDELDSIVIRWNKGLIPVLLLQPKAVSHGLNLQDGGCADICWFSLTFDLEQYEQVIKRVHRQGVKNTVTVHHIVANGTVDFNVLDALEGKSDMQQALLNSLLK